MKTYSLRQRWIRFCLIGVASLSLLYTVYCVVAMYVVEDAMIGRLMQLEIERRDPTSRGAANFMQWYDEVSALPSDLRQRYQGRGNAEIAGDDHRHYHVREVPDGKTNRYLVAEVSTLLVVRPLRSEIMLWLLATAAILLLLSVWWSYRMATRLTVPLQQLMQALHHLESTPLTTGIKDIPSNEIGQLIHQLEAALQRIQQMLAREKQFTRDVSHELRTPLAVITTSLAALKNDISPGSQPLLNRMQDAVTRINEDLSVLLALARERTVESLAPYPILPLIEHCVIEHAARIGDKPIVVKVEVPPQLMTTAPEAVMRIVLSNVISNAFIYCAQGSVTIVQTGHNVLNILDTGPGVGNANDTSVQGLGIGLTIVRRLCDAYQISCQWRANDPTGTCVSLTLPQHCAD